MRLASFRRDGVVRAGVVSGDAVHAFDPGTTVRDLVDLGLDRALELAAQAAQGPSTPLSEVQLLPPLRPASIRDFVAFEEHVDGVRRSIENSPGIPEAWYDAPTFYFGNPHAILGPGDDIPFPARSVARDFELEVAVVVGAPGSSLSETGAASHVFGYTIMNDWSARDLQGREMQVGLGPAKGKDFATTLGPWLVTADELAPHRDDDGFLQLWCSASVDGREVGRDLLSNMGWTFETMIAYASRDAQVMPGDVLGSGTVGNGGCLAELWGRNGAQDPPPLADGAVVTLTVEGIGSLTNRVASAPPPPPISPPRRRGQAAARAAG